MKTYYIVYNRYNDVTDATFINTDREIKTTRHVVEVASYLEFIKDVEEVVILSWKEVEYDNHIMSLLRLKNG